MPNYADTTKVNISGILDKWQLYCCFVAGMLGNQRPRAWKAALKNAGWKSLMEEEIDDATKRNLTARVTRWSLRGGVIESWKAQLETALKSRAAGSEASIYRDELAEIAKRLNKS